MQDYRAALLEPRDRAMLDFAMKLTRTPGDVSRGDLDELRGLGFDDASIHDIVQVVALFNYYDRLASGLGVEPEPEWGRYPE